MSLPVITGSQPKKVHEFYKKLVYNVQSLETLGKLGDVTGNTRAVLDKLRGIKMDLVRGQDGWQEWDFPQLVQALKRWKDINTIEANEIEGVVSTKRQEPRASGYTRSYHAEQKTQEGRTRGCVYCDETDHKAGECRKYVTVEDRRKMLGTKRLCFNCTGTKHHAAECKSRTGCLNCGQRHHTSICPKGTHLMTATAENENAVIYPVVVVNVEGVKCRVTRAPAAHMPLRRCLTKYR